MRINKRGFLIEVVVPALLLAFLLTVVLARTGDFGFEDKSDSPKIERDYQKETIRVTTQYLLGGQYNNLEELAGGNYHQNPVPQETYGSLGDLYKHLQFSDKLSCAI